MCLFVKPGPAERKQVFYWMVFSSLFGTNETANSAAGRMDRLRMYQTPCTAYQKATVGA